MTFAVLVQRLSSKPQRSKASGVRIQVSNLYPSYDSKSTRTNLVFVAADTIDLVIWGIAEGAITIIAASIPILRALLRDPNKSTTDNVSHYMEQKPSQAGQV